MISEEFLTQSLRMVGVEGRAGHWCRRLGCRLQLLGCRRDDSGERRDVSQPALRVAQNFCNGVLHENFA